MNFFNTTETAYLKELKDRHTHFLDHYLMPFQSFTNAGQQVSDDIYHNSYFLWQGIVSIYQSVQILCQSLYQLLRGDLNQAKNHAIQAGISACSWICKHTLVLLIAAVNILLYTSKILASLTSCLINTPSTDKQDEDEDETTKSVHGEVDTYYIELINDVLDANTLTNTILSEKRELEIKLTKLTKLTKKNLVDCPELQRLLNSYPQLEQAIIFGPRYLSSYKDKLTTHHEKVQELFKRVKATTSEHAKTVGEMHIEAQDYLKKAFSMIDSNSKQLDKLIIKSQKPLDDPKTHEQKGIDDTLNLGFNLGFNKARFLIATKLLTACQSLLDENNLSKSHDKIITIFSESMELSADINDYSSNKTSKQTTAKELSEPERDVIEESENPSLSL